jgi:hypothetical protein
VLDAPAIALVCSNHRGTNALRLEKELVRAAAPRKVAVLDRPSLPEDFAEDPGYAASLFARVE